MRKLDGTMVVNKLIMTRVAHDLYLWPRYIEVLFGMKGLSWCLNYMKYWHSCFRETWLLCFFSGDIRLDIPRALDVKELLIEKAAFVTGIRCYDTTKFSALISATSTKHRFPRS